MTYGKCEICEVKTETKDGNKNDFHGKISHKLKLGLLELQTIIRKMPLQSCCVHVVPEFGVRWKEVSRAVRQSRLAMTASSVAQVLCRHSSSLPAEEVNDIVARLRLKLIATQDRKWHVIRLQEPTAQLSVAHLLRALSSRVARAAAQGRSARAARPEVQVITLNDLVYLSVQMVSENRAGPILYVATPPGQPVALASSLSNTLLKAVVEGLGYEAFEDAQLFGHDIPSLLRIADEGHARAEHLLALPAYAPAPTVRGNTVDFTTQRYDDHYVDMVLGPDPPLLTELKITSTRPLLDGLNLRRPVSLKIHIKSENIAKMLRGWVRIGALAPTSDFLQIFTKIKVNKFDYQFDED